MLRALGVLCVSICSVRVSQLGTDGVDGVVDTGLTWVLPVRMSRRRSVLAAVKSSSHFLKKSTVESSLLMMNLFKSISLLEDIHQALVCLID